MREHCFAAAGFYARRKTGIKFGMGFCGYAWPETSRSGAVSDGRD